MKVLIISFFLGRAFFENPSEELKNQYQSKTQTEQLAIVPTNISVRELNSNFDFELIQKFFESINSGFVPEPKFATPQGGQVRTSNPVICLS